MEVDNFDLDCFDQAFKKLALDQSNCFPCIETVSVSGAIRHRQEEKQRSCEASRQMLYEVFENTIGILEEFERREGQQMDINIKRTYVNIPDQSKKSSKDVQVILQAQILILQTQIVTCVSSIRNAASEELRHQTLLWLAVRHKQEMPISLTDQYGSQIFDVLSKKEIEHPAIFKQLPGDVQDVSMSDMMQVLFQQYRICFIDNKFICGMAKEKVLDIGKEDIDLGKFRLIKFHEFGPVQQLTFENPRWGYLIADSVT